MSKYIITCENYDKNKLDKQFQATANYINDVLNQSAIKDPVKNLDKNDSAIKCELKSEVFI